MKDYLNYLKSLTSHITKLFLLVAILQAIVFSQIDSAKVEENTGKTDSSFIMQKSPFGAVLRSAVIPGWGQIYNESYIKVPVIWGIFAGLAAGWVFYNNKYVDSRNLFLQTQVNNYKESRDFYKDQRDLMGIYIGIAYLLNLVDAYVDAQLFDFNVNEDNFSQQRWLNLRVKL